MVCCRPERVDALQDATNGDGVDLVAWFKVPMSWSGSFALLELFHLTVQGQLRSTSRCSFQRSQLPEQLPCRRQAVPQLGDGRGRRQLLR